MFLIYNLIRSNWSLVIFILLQIIKYVIYAFYFYPEVNFIVIGMLILVYPVPNIIERFSYKRYNLSLFMNWLPNKIVLHCLGPCISEYFLLALFF